MQANAKPSHHLALPNLAFYMGLFLALSGCSTASLEPASQNPSMASIQAACESLVLDYAYYRDREDLQLAAQGVAAIFTQDATLTVNGQSFTGRRAIHDRIADQTNPPLFAHLMSTIRIFPESATKATGVSYATVYVAPRPAQGSALAEGFAAVGEYHDEFRLTDEGWRISKRTFIARIRYKRDEA